MHRLFFTDSEDGDHKIKGFAIADFDIPIYILFKICKDVWINLTNETGITAQIRELDIEGYSQFTDDKFVVKSSRRGVAIYCNMGSEQIVGLPAKTVAALGHIFRRRVEEAVEELKSQLNDDTDLMGVLGI